MYDKKQSTFLFRKKIHHFIKPVLVISVIFIVYQVFMFFQLTRDIQKLNRKNFVLGVHEQQGRFYVPDQDGFFVCIHSMEKVLFKYVNDNYCDCLDGSDEPGTSACANGNFVCTLQVTYKNFPKVLPSNRVNDGICDCCDGSDEWKLKELPFKLKDEIQQKLQRFQTPCPNLCGY